MDEDNFGTEAKVVRGARLGPLAPYHVGRSHDFMQLTTLFVKGQNAMFGHEFGVLQYSGEAVVFRLLQKRSVSWREL